MARTQYLASKPRYEILDGLRGVAALAVLTGVAALGTLDLTLNLNLTGLLDGRIGAPFTVNGGWSLTPAELYVGLVRLLYPFFAGLLLSRLRRRPALRGAFGWKWLKRA